MRYKLMSCQEYVMCNSEIQALILSYKMAYIIIFHEFIRVSEKTMKTFSISSKVMERMNI